MTTKCECTIHIQAYYPEYLVLLIQEYLHKKPTVSLYERKLANFSLCLRLDKDNTIQELSHCSYFRDNQIDYYANPFVFTVEDKFVGIWEKLLYLNFRLAVDNEQYGFSKSLTTGERSPNQENDNVPMKQDKYYNCYIRLLELSDPNNIGALIKEIKTQCRFIPKTTNFKLIQQIIATKITTLFPKNSLHDYIHG
jgi:hypothetical protein